MTQAIVLNAIVKNEAHVIRRMLDSVRPFVSRFCILDTGSTDGTPEIIREHMATLGIPGELHEREWKGYDVSRNESLDLARAMLARDGLLDRAYILTVDADDCLEAKPGFQWPALTAEGYLLRFRFADARPRDTKFAVTRAAAPWAWRGKLHERLWLGDMRATSVELPLIGDLTYVAHRDGIAHPSDRAGWIRTETDRIAFLEQLVADPDAPDLREQYARDVLTGYLTLEHWLGCEKFIRSVVLATEQQWSRSYRYTAAITLGLCLLRQSRPALEVCAVFERARDIMPERPEAHRHLARVQRSLLTRPEAAE